LSLGYFLFSSFIYKSNITMTLILFIE